MKLFYGPGACSMGIHILLEEAGAAFETQAVSTRDGGTRKPEFLAVNPKGKVPALLLDDGGLVTEFPAIARYLARTFPAAKLAPVGAEAELAADMAAEFICATVHMQGFTRIFRPGNFSADPATHDAVRARGQEIAEEGFGILAAQLGDKNWIAGSFSYADAALFFVEFWGVVRVKMTLPPALDAHFRRMLARPSTKRMMEREGLGV